MCACTLGINRACPLEPRIKCADWSRPSVIGTQSSAPTGPATHSSCGFMLPLLKIAKYGQGVFALVSSSLDEWWQVIVVVPRGQTTSKAPNCCCPPQLQLNLASCCNNQCHIRNRPPCALLCQALCILCKFPCKMPLNCEALCYCWSIWLYPLTSCFGLHIGRITFSVFQSAESELNPTFAGKEKADSSPHPPVSLQTDWSRLCSLF